MKRLVLSVAILCAFTANAQEPARKGWMGVNGSFSDKGMAVDTTVPGSTMHKLGVRKGDTILQLNGKPITGMGSYNATAGAIRTGEQVAVQYKRGNKIQEKRPLLL